MNTFKFRIWNPKYQDFDYWGFFGDHEFKSPPTGTFTIAGAREQSRQLKPFVDKNGKEIYDDDVVRVTRVNWVNEPEGNVYQHTMIMTPEITEIYKGDIMSQLKEFEVIGNIYQNPEYATNPVP